MRWLLASNKPKDQHYAESVLKSLANAEAIVPNLWHLEAANVLLGATNRNEIEVSELERFTVQLENLPISVDTSTAHQVFGHTISLAKAYRLSSYDAAYLELALREGLPLATLDKDLLRAAKRSDVEIYLK
jgi:predicted nucleic acid-binding protein